MSKSKSTKIGRIFISGEDVLTGGIRTLKFSQAFRLEKNENKRGSSSPDYIVQASSHADRQLCDIGAAWENEKNGRKYLSISLSDPDIPDRFSELAAFPHDDKPGEYDVIWSPPEHEAA